jgi:AraC-like DNA-binding protein
MLVNPTDVPVPVVLVPDGRVDVLFSFSAEAPYRVLLLGLQNQPEDQVIAPHSTMFAISCTLLAVEYLLPAQGGSLLHDGRELPIDYLNMSAEDLQNFDTFCANASARLTQALPNAVDPRKRTLFALLYASQGSRSVEALAEAAGWSPREINRYFTRLFGLSLKAYSSILRFRATWPQLKAGHLYADGDFADQSHFIREVRKYTGAAPKEVARNYDDRFIQFSTLPEK